MGYKWGFRFDSDQTSYWLHLIKDGQELHTGMFSSGEREIVHFLLAMFALNIKDGLIRSMSQNFTCTRDGSGSSCHCFAIYRQSVTISLS